MRKKKAKPRAIAKFQPEPMTLYPNSMMWVRTVIPDETGKLIKKDSIVRVDEANKLIPFSTFDIDYGHTKFGGRKRAKQKKGKGKGTFYIMHNKHHNRRAKHGSQVVIGTRSKEHPYLAPFDISAAKEERIGLQLAEMNDKIFGVKGGFNYFRNTFRRYSVHYNVGSMKVSGYIYTMTNMYLKGGQYYGLSKGGMRALLFDTSEISRPSIKTTAPQTKTGSSGTYNNPAKQFAKDRGFDEGMLMTDDPVKGKIILDCSSSNVIGVKVINKVLHIYDPKLDKRALNGITKQTMVKALKRYYDVVVHVGPIKWEDLPEFDFMCSFGSAAGPSLIRSVTYLGKTHKFTKVSRFATLRNMYNRISDERMEFTGIKTY